MARRIKTNLEKMDASIKSLLKKYGNEVAENVDEITLAIGRRGANAMKRSSAEMNFGGKGTYAKGWAVAEEKHRLYTTVIIYNKTPGLPHLLEHGHLLRDGSRWLPPRQHIEPVETELLAQFEKEVQSKL